MVPEIYDKELGFFSVRLNSRDYFFHESLAVTTSGSAVVLSGNKFIANRYLHQKGFPVPDVTQITSLEDADVFLDKHGSIVLKPLVGEGGEGVIVDISGPEELKASYERLIKSHRDIYAEQMVRGHDIRLLIIDYQPVAALERVPARVVGDGRRTIAELIKQREAELRLRDPKVTIPVDAETARVLRKQHVTLQDIVRPGKEIVIRLTANFHTGGAIHNITGQLSPRLKEAARTIADTVGIPVLGVDFCLPDPVGEEYSVLEINERPNLAFHMHPDTGEPINTAGLFVNFFLDHIR